MNDIHGHTGTLRRSADGLRTVAGQVDPAPLPPLRARYPLLLVLVGWACSAVAGWADGHYVTDLLTACRDSSGIPVYAPAAGWAGLLASVAGTLWIAGQLIAFARKRARPFTWTNGSLFAVVPVVLFALLVQADILGSARDDTGHQRTHCTGLARSLPQHR